MSGELRIRDVVERTGIGEATLRAWEQRHGFPVPERLPSGHRRYSERDVEVLRAVARARDAGQPVHAAIEQALARTAGEPRSAFAAVRAARPDLAVNVLPKPALVAISHAIEDETLRGGSDVLLFGAFQRVRHYRDSEARWRELARAADAAIVFADFRRPRRGRPVEVAISRGDPLEREWVLVCESARSSACLVAWEPPGQAGTRRFEAMWTTDRAAARAAARVLCSLAERRLPDGIAERVAAQPALVDGEAGRAEALTNRIVAYLASSRATASRR
jgi:DICT domain-containing protein/predicted DNA-binding transcriptional regulator AlpA